MNTLVKSIIVAIALSLSGCYVHPEHSGYVYHPAPAVVYTPPPAVVYTPRPPVFYAPRPRIYINPWGHWRGYRYSNPYRGRGWGMGGHHWRR